MAGKRVLIVESKREVSRELRKNLEGLQNGFEIVEVLSGEEATLVAHRAPVDLLVVDTHLPGMDGLELVTKLRAKQPDLNLILLNGNPAPPSKDLLSHARADAILDKPIHSPDFLSAVQRILGLGQTRTAGNPLQGNRSGSAEERKTGPGTNGEEVDALDPKMEKMLQASAKKKIEQEELDAFWSSSGESKSSTAARGGSLTYHQALEKGLLPHNEPLPE